MKGNKGMAIKRCGILLFLSCVFAFTCYTQQGSGMEQVGEDTLIRNRPVDNGGFKPIANINTFYRVHVGAAYSFVKPDSAENTIRYNHTIGLNYSFTEKSFHPYYRGILPNVIGKLHLQLAAGYDEVRRVNYYGVGNESKRDPNNREFNWLRTETVYASTALTRNFARFHTLGWSVLYDGIRVHNDVGRFASKDTATVEAAQYKRQDFLGSRLFYSFDAINRPYVPTKGLQFVVSGAYTENLVREGHSFARFTGDLNVYVPLFNRLSYVLRTGVATIHGNPDFYQLNSVGGTNTIRGYERFRFYGKTSFYNQNELRWLPTIETKLYTGELGFFALFDQGRVWQPGEISTKMHYGYGGGIIVTPLNKVVITAAYALSNEDGRFHLNLRRIF